jgi:hypothetical protein
MRATSTCLGALATPIAYHHPVAEQPPLSLWHWGPANRYFQITRNHLFEKLTLDGWIAADTYYLWRCWEDPEFRELSGSPKI